MFQFELTTVWCQYKVSAGASIKGKKAVCKDVRLDILPPETDSYWRRFDRWKISTALLKITPGFDATEIDLNVSSVLKISSDGTWNPVGGSAPLQSFNNPVWAVIEFLFTFFLSVWWMDTVGPDVLLHKLCTNLENSIWKTNDQIVSRNSLHDLWQNYSLLFSCIWCSPRHITQSSVSTLK